MEKAFLFYFDFRIQFLNVRSKASQVHEIHVEHIVVA